MIELENLVRHLNRYNEKDLSSLLLSTLEKHAGVFEEYDDLAKTHFKLKDYPNAIRCCEKASMCAYTNEKLYAIRTNLVNVLNHANEPERAMRYIKQCEMMIPHDVDIQLEKAFSYFLLNEKDKAEALLLHVLENTPDLPEETITKVKFNLGTYALIRDEFQKGLRGFLLEGKKMDFWQKAKLPYPFWEGGIQPGRTIVLFAEAGIGDEIINVRFMKHLQDYGMNPVWLTDRKDLAEIFNANGFRTITHINQLEDTKNICWTYPMSLPVYLHLEYEDLWYGPYIKPLANHHVDIPKSDKVKIGLRWNGNTEYSQALHRELSLVEMMNIIDGLDMDLDLYSLQRDDNMEPLYEYNNTHTRQIKDMSSEMVTYSDTLSIIDQLDVVITSCTSIAHASLAMGKTTIVLVPISAYYLWCNTWGHKSPWYSSSKDEPLNRGLILIRQSKPRSWEGPMAELRELLPEVIKG